MPPVPTKSATGPYAPWTQNLVLIGLQPSLQIAADCWNLLSAPDGNSRRQVYLPQGEREPQSAYERRLAAARPSGFFRDALRTYAGMLSRGSWLNLPSNLASVLTDVDGRGTDLGVFLASADLLVLPSIPVQGDVEGLASSFLKRPLRKPRLLQQSWAAYRMPWSTG